MDLITRIQQQMANISTKAIQLAQNARVCNPSAPPNG